GGPGNLRRAGDGAHAVAVRGRHADDAEQGRRRGSRAGDLPQGLPRLWRVPGGHQPAGLALPDPDQHLHQHLPGQEATSRRERPRRRRGPLPLPAPGRPRVGPGRPQRRGRGARRIHRRGGEGGARGPSGPVPDGRSAGRRRGFPVQGDRRHPRHPHRNRHVKAAPGKKSATEVVVRVRSPAPPGRRTRGPAV
ncbi:MAG: RNA polymerase ECF-type sigma factor, partial [uncultured Acidimicrobiales bacterium]